MGDLEGEELDELDEREGEEDEDEMIPHKLLEKVIDLEIKCRILYIDMEGRSDDQSMQIMIEQSTLYYFPFNFTIIYC